MRRFVLARIKTIVILACLLASLSCGHDQQLASIEIQPGQETFGAANIPVQSDSGLSVQLRALGHYIHPPVTKDITNQVVWNSNDTQMVAVNSSGLLSVQGVDCGSSLVSATMNTNKSSGGIGSTGALVTGNMTANVVCFTGGGSGSATLTITFAGTGSGTVSVSPSNTICQSTCFLSFPVGSGPIMLTAAANGTFGGWGNCPSANGTVCTINTLSADLNLTATFN